MLEECSIPEDCRQAGLVERVRVPSEQFVRESEGPREREGGLHCAQSMLAMVSPEVRAKKRSGVVCSAIEQTRRWVYVVGWADAAVSSVYRRERPRRVIVSERLTAVGANRLASTFSKPFSS